ncbi:MAG: DUF4149 domain-containing protein [Burkholderiaceae bacterium]
MKTLGWLISKARFLLLAFSWGALGVVGALVVPLLFKNLDSKHLAGVLAAQLFIWVSLLSLLCALMAVLCTLWAHLQKKQALSLIHLRQAPSFLWGVAALGASLAMLLGIIPSIQLGQDRALWHALGSVLYVVMWVLSGALLMEDAKRCFHTKLASEP